MVTMLGTDPTLRGALEAGMEDIRQEIDALKTERDKQSEQLAAEDEEESEDKDESVKWV